MEADMGFYGYRFYGMDWTVLLLAAGMVLSLLASAGMKRTFSVYCRIPSASRMTGAQTAQRILSMAGLSDVQVRPVSGQLTDHYDPRTVPTGLLPWQRWEWRPMSADTRCSITQVMRL